MYRSYTYSYNKQQAPNPYLNTDANFNIYLPASNHVHNSQNYYRNNNYNNYDNRNQTSYQSLSNTGIYSNNTNYNNSQYPINNNQYQNNNSQYQINNNQYQNNNNQYPNINNQYQNNNNQYPNNNNKYPNINNQYQNNNYNQYPNNNSQYPNINNQYQNNNSQYPNNNFNQYPNNNYNNNKKSEVNYSIQGGIYGNNNNNGFQEKGFDSSSNIYGQQQQNNNANNYETGFSSGNSSIYENNNTNPNPPSNYQNEPQFGNQIYSQQQSPQNNQQYPPNVQNNYNQQNQYQQQTNNNNNNFYSQQNNSNNNNQQGQNSQNVNYQQMKNGNNLNYNNGDNQNLPPINSRDNYNNQVQPQNNNNFQGVNPQEQYNQNNQINNFNNNNFQQIQNNNQPQNFQNKNNNPNDMNLSYNNQSDNNNKFERNNNINDNNINQNNNNNNFINNNNNNLNNFENNNNINEQRTDSNLRNNNDNALEFKTSIDNKIINKEDNQKIIKQDEQIQNPKLPDFSEFINISNKSDTINNLQVHQKSENGNINHTIKEEVSNPNLNQNLINSPKIEFKGDITKMKILHKIPYEAYHLDRILLFKNYFLINQGKGIAFVEKDTYKIIFSQKIEVEEIQEINIIDEDTFIIVAFDKLRIIRFEEKEPKKFAYEIIQEICETELYYAGMILSNGLLLAAGEDEKFSFYKLEKYDIDKKLSKNNLYKKIGEVENVHKVLMEDLPRIIDLKNGFIISFTNCFSDIAVVQYNKEFTLIKKIIENTLEWDTAELISDKYVLFTGVGNGVCNTCLFDVEKLELVNTWDHDDRIFFLHAIGKNKFFEGNDKQFKLCELKEDNGEFIIKEIFVTDYQGFDVFVYPFILDEKSFLTCAYDKPPNSEDYDDDLDINYLEQRNAYLVVFQCE